MRVSVFVSKTYALRSMAGGVLANENGEVLETLVPGQQLHVTALEPVWVLPDDCQMAMVNFKQAARELGLLAGGKSGLPAGYTRVEFLESSGTQYITLPEVQTGEDFGMDYTFLNTSGQNWALNLQTGNAVHYRVDVRNFDTGAIGLSWGEYSNSVWVDVGEGGESCSFVANYKNDKRYVIKGLKTYEGALKTPNTVKNGFYLFAMTEYTAEGVRYKGQNVKIKIKHFAASKGQADVAHLVPTLNPTGTPCMYDKVSKQPFQNSGSGTFIAGFTMSQAAKLGKLPATGGSLTISLPKEARLVQHNQRVESALATATEKGWNISVQYREAGEEAIYNRYAECTTGTEIKAVNPNYKSDLTDEGEWIYSLNKLESDNGTFYAATKLKVFKQTLPSLKKSHTMFQQAGLTTLEIDLPVLETASNLAYGCGSLQTVIINAPKSTGMSSAIHACGRVTTLKGSFPKVQNGSSMAYNALSLRTVEAEFPRLIYGSGMFHRCKLNKESALRILNSIPICDENASYNLTLGIHIDHQNDEELLAAIALADKAQTTNADGGKGWTLEIQWNGTPTAQATTTYGLRRKPIYAKLGTMELPDGSTEQYLSWGHYVTNWEEHGYQEFASIEEAEEHFNIKKEITE